MATLSLGPIGVVEAPRASAEDDFRGGEEACIVLDARFAAESLQGIEKFSHLEVLYHFHAEVCQPAWAHGLMRAYWLGR